MKVDYNTAGALLSVDLLKALREGEIAFSEPAFVASRPLKK